MPPGSWISSAPGRAFASWIAARSVQAPATVLQTPSPTLASRASAVLLTVNRAGLAKTTVLATRNVTRASATTATATGGRRYADLTGLDIGTVNSAQT